MSMTGLRVALDSLTNRAVTWLPGGRWLPDEIFRRRHRGILVLLWLHAIAIFAQGTSGITSVGLNAVALVNPR